MKTIRIVLLLLIVLGLGLLATQQYWLPKLVNQILEWQGVATGPIDEMPTGTTTLTNTATSSSEFMSDWNWVDGQVGETKFSRPDQLPTTYVTAVDWPPQVTVTPEKFVCDTTSAKSSGAVVDRRTINDRIYCVTTLGEGAAGSTYTTYRYVVEEGDVVETVYFTLRTPQCMIYDDPLKSECKAEQAEFDVDALASKIAESITLY